MSDFNERLAQSIAKVTGKEAPRATAAAEKPASFADRATTRAKELGSQWLKWAEAALKGGGNLGLTAYELSRDPKNMELMSTVMGYPEGIARTALGDVIGRITGKDDITQEDYKNALLAKPLSGDEILARTTHAPDDWRRAVAGFLLEAGASPAFLADSVRKAIISRNPWGLLAMQGTRSGPLSEAGSEFGEWMFQRPWRPSDAAILEYNDADRFTDREFSKMLWNNGNPLFNPLSSNKNIKDTVQNVVRGAGKRLRSILGDVDVEIDLAPGATKFSDDFAEEYVQRQIKKEARRRAGGTVEPQKDMWTGKVIEPEDSPELKKHIEELTARAADPNDPEFQIIRKAAQDRAKRQLKRRLSAGFAGEANAREAAVKQLKEITDPRLHELIDELGGKFAAGRQDEARAALNAIMDDVFEGKRTTQQLADLTSSYRQAAAGSSKLDTNQYKTTAKANVPKQIDAATGSKLSKITEDAIEQGFDDVAEGKAKRADYQKAKRDYAVLRRGEENAVRVLERAENKPIVTSTDAAVGGYAAGRAAQEAEGGLGPLLALILKKPVQWTIQSPRFGGTVGLGAHKLAGSNIWDAMATSGYLMGTREER